MIDKWFKKDLDRIFDKHQVAVFIDESKKAGFLLDTVKDNYRVFTANDEIQELFSKYQIEKNRDKGGKFLVYTQTPKDRLKFVREYCETNGHVEIKYLHNYIKEKVHKSLGLNLNLEKDELISAAKISLGKDQTYWMDLSHKGASEIFEMKKELLPFLNDPEGYIKKFDATVSEIFYKKVNNLLDQDYIKKPPKTLANEVANKIFEGLAYNKSNKILTQVYLNWLDSISYKSSLEGYLKKYKLPDHIDIWNVHSLHPFTQIDELWLKDLGNDLFNRNKIADLLPKIKQRVQNKQITSPGTHCWKEINTLLEFDEKGIASLTTFEECVKYYTNKFFKIDQAIRNLYTCYLDRKELLEPFQEYYRNLSNIFLEKWFNYFEQYKQNQTGTIQQIIENSKSKTAIIVGDGVTYEIAQNIINKVSKEYGVNNDDKPDYMLADIPSETEHNMSQLYVSGGEDYTIHKDREKYLNKHFEDKDIGYIHLEDVSEATDKHHYLICTYKDIDDVGEKLQQRALKFFPEIEEVFAKSIEQLLRNGYRKVYLVTDHGFVLTGILSSSDKIEVDFTGKVHKSERYIRTVNKQEINKNLFIETEQKYKGFNYLYFSKTLNPFKTPGVYGYSHGGISPQELIIPFVCWESSLSETGTLSVSISNKGDLESVTGENFQIGIKAETDTVDLFTTERKIILMFFSRGKQISKSEIITINKDQEITGNYTFRGHEKIEIKLLDANTKEQLDKAVVKQDKARDLKGLL